MFENVSENRQARKSVPFKAVVSNAFLVMGEIPFQQRGCAVVTGPKEAGRGI
jgi:hypothetical protein